MVLTAHQPGYLPWIGLFHKIALADTYVIFDGVQYKPKHTDSRNKIKTHNGVQWLSVPCDRRDHFNTKIKDVRIQDGNWRRKHWRTLYLAYRKAPYFDRYAGFLEWIYGEEWELLVNLDTTLLGFLVNQIFPVENSVPIHRASNMDLKGSKSALVLDMCLKMGADTYIFGKNGRNYMGEDGVRKFEDAGVRVVFQDFQHPTYPQLHGDFVPYMSAIDLLFNLGRDSFETMMSGNARSVEEM